MARVLISGSSGLIGSALVLALEADGYEVTRLVRSPARSEKELQWEPMHEVSPAMVSGFDAVVHLSGENVAGRWTAEKKRKIRESRVASTRNLAWAIAKSERPPQMFVCASAIGYYGNRGDEVLTEDSAAGVGFLPDVCREWEAATHVGIAGVRVVNLRFGIVLSKNGGALKEMLRPFRLGVGGRVGSGRQWWSWIHIEDAIAVILNCLPAGRERPSPNNLFGGPVNIVSPNPVTNGEFTRVLAAVMKRPAIFAVPGFAAKLAFGEFAEEGILASARVMPRKLEESGFEFRYRDLVGAVTQLLR
ncbi:MAG TPA: TIGR01777 family oxidoreductase [Candidatus Sulfotelmatobacter sp.]|jgi:hypothetical protein|nr:TIGR01777 family oxidoreductase [Candidatus Sulfotelmatobacter sp.]